MKNNLSSYYLPTQMPMFAGSPGFPNISNAKKRLYFIAWLIIGTCAGVLANFIPANTAAFASFLHLNSMQSALLVGIYFMFSTWASLLLFKLRQHFGVQFFVKFVIFFLSISVLMRIFLEDSFANELVIRAIYGFVCTSLSVISIFYAGQFLPREKRMLMLLLGLGLIQLGLPLDRLISSYLISDFDLTYIFILELVLSILCIFMLKITSLPPSFMAYELHLKNLFTLIIFALSCMCFTLALSLINTIWWDNELVFKLFSLALFFLALFIFLEFIKKEPMVNVKFLSKVDIVKIIILAACMRIFLAEQNISTSGFFINTLSYSDYQLRFLYLYIFLGSLSGFIASYYTLKGFNRFSLLVFISFLILSLASFLCANLNPYSKPSDVYLGQFLISFAGIYFMTPLLIDGIIKAMARGVTYLVSFSCIFSFAQNIFGLLGSSFVNYFLIYKSKIISSNIITNSSNFNQDYINKFANANAYNEMFLIISVFSFLVFLFLFLEWLFFKLKKKNPNARELQIIMQKVQKRVVEEQKLLGENNEKI